MAWGCQWCEYEMDQPKTYPCAQCEPGDRNCGEINEWIWMNGLTEGERLIQHSLPDP